MAIRISDLDPLGSGLKKNDKFEVTKTDEGKSYSCTPEDILNYCKNQSNGAFRGTTSESLDSLTYNAIGVWQWTGSGGPNNTTSGMLEVISETSPTDTSGTNWDIVQRLTSGPFVYQRAAVDGNFSPWRSLANVNGCRIQYGVSSESTVDFPVTFASTPSVVVIPFNTSAEAYVNIVNLTAVSPSNFTVARYKSSLVSVITTESTTQTESGGTKTTTTTSETTRGAWEAGDFSFYWVAMLEEG